MAQLVRHIGRRKSTGAKLAVVFRTLPNDNEHCLVVEVDRLPDMYKDNFKDIVASSECQNEIDLYKALQNRPLATGALALNAFHQLGFLTKAAIDEVIMMPMTGHEVPLRLINEQIDKSTVAADIAQPSEVELAVQQAEQGLVEDPVSEAKRLMAQVKQYEDTAETLRAKAYQLDPTLIPKPGRPAVYASPKEANKARETRRKERKVSKEIDAKVADHLARKAKK